MTGRKPLQLFTPAFEGGDDFDANLSRLLSIIESYPSGSLILFPEVALTNFSYTRFDEAASFAQTIDTRLLAASIHYTIVLTLIEKEEGAFYNVAKCYHRGSIIHTQAKYRLFTLGEETRHFTPAASAPVTRFECCGYSIGMLICFELRFTEYWQALRGTDIILIPTQWGKIRSEHLQTLSQALAIANQCYVAVCDSANEDCSGYQALISPFGERHLLGGEINPKEITKMRKYLDVGLHG